MPHQLCRSVGIACHTCATQVAGLSSSQSHSLVAYGSACLHLRHHLLVFILGITFKATCTCTCCFACMPRWLSWYSICLERRRSRVRVPPEAALLFLWKKELSSGVVACICLVSITDYSCTCGLAYSACFLGHTVCVCEHT